jgi:hypothetical protein
MANRVWIAGVAALMIAGTARAETPPPLPPAGPVPSSSTVLLPRDTPLILMATKEVSTAEATPGTIFKLRVHEPVLVAGRTVIPVGATALGRVEAAVDSGGLGKSGRMTARLLHVILGEAEIPLDGSVSAKGTGAGSAGVAVIFTGVVGLFHRGNNAKIKAGELVSGFVAEDVLLDLDARPVRRVAAPAPASKPVSAPAP